MANAEEVAMKVPTNRFQRMLLHLACMARDHHWTWHWQGICREFFNS